MGALNILNREIRTVAQTQAITVTNATNADTADALTNARMIGGVAFDGTTNINLPGVNQAGNQNTSGTANNATNLNSIAASNYARKDSGAGQQTFNNNVRVVGTINATGNIGAFVS